MCGQPSPKGSSEALLGTNTSLQAHDGSMVILAPPGQGSRELEDRQSQGAEVEGELRWKGDW
jgi:hypothetical protein